jgi:hypothetical protein
MVMPGIQDAVNRVRIVDHMNGSEDRNLASDPASERTLQTHSTS